MRVYVFILFLVLSPWSRAEYRAYRLGVKYKPTDKKELQVVTTLDNYQYETYYKVSLEQQTRIIEHWMCRGRTGDFASPCRNPASIKPTTVDPKSSL